MPVINDFPDSVLELVFSYTNLLQHEPVVFMTCSCVCPRLADFLLRWLEEYFHNQFYCRRCHIRVILEDMNDWDGMCDRCNHDLIGAAWAAYRGTRHRYRLILQLWMTLDINADDFLWYIQR